MAASHFDTTQWTLVVAAGDSQNPGSHAALAALCQSYWYPLYAYLRRRGFPQEESEDLVQGFFAQLLEKNYLKAADRQRGRFRSFLLASLKNFAANEWDKKTAQKRGGAATTLSLDFETAEGRYTIEPADERTPEQEFDRRWAMAQLEHVFARMRSESGESIERFDLLQGFLTGEGADVRYKEVAERLSMSEGAVKVAVHRLRQRFGVVLRDEVARTLNDPAEIDDEIRHLFAAFES
jgi:RNA polymerase sigma-70 factor (ECF subfamily)